LKAAICIPTYWTDRVGRLRPGEAVYDHPTLLEGGQETLTRCLKSLTSLKGEFEVYVLAVPSWPGIASQVEKKVGKLLGPFKGELNVKGFYPSSLKKLKRFLQRKGLGRFSRSISLKGYGNVRNLCILLPYLAGLDAAILVDDDEIVTEEDFLHKGLQFLGRRWRGKPIGGVAGYYVYRDGNYRLKVSPAPWSLVWDKASLMNEAFKIIDSRRRLNPTSFAFGGCMAIHRSLIREVCFDPWITRGEDIDYLLCAKAYGFEFPLDNQWKILHDPPPKQRGFWGEFEQDVYRFLYQREKLKLLEEKLGLNLLTGELDPFPGYFLKEDLEGKILLTGILALASLETGRLLQAKTFRQLAQALKPISLLLQKARKYALKNAGKYFGFRELWLKALTSLEGEYFSW